MAGDTVAANDLETLLSCVLLKQIGRNLLIRQSASHRARCRIIINACTPGGDPLVAVWHSCARSTTRYSHERTVPACESFGGPSCHGHPMAVSAVQDCVVA